MAETDQTHHVVNNVAAVTMANRAGDRPAELARDLPGIVIFIHGVKDPGAVYETVEKGLCQGLNERLSRGSDLQAGAYGVQYQAAASKPNAEVSDNSVLSDPDTYQYQRSEARNTKSVFIPFYWGYRPKNADIAKDKNNKTVRVRGQYQDKKGNRLDKHFAKAGGFFANATNNIPDMYGAGFKAPFKGKAATYTGASGNYVYIADAPERRYFVLAAERLATLISTIRGIEPSGAASAANLKPINDTITVLGHSQGTIITLLAQALLVQRGQRCADCVIMVDSPYSVYTTEESSQTARAKLKTLVDIVNEVTKQPYSVPQLAELLIAHERHGGRAGKGWTPTKGTRKEKTGKNWITFDERDNRGKVYLYFCPEDTVVALSNIRGIGTYGVPDYVHTDTYYWDPNRTRPQSYDEKLPAMEELKNKRFYQRMWTRMERDHNFDGKYKRVLVGTPPARVPIREAYERLSVGPEAGWSLLGSAKAQAVNAATQVSHTRNDIRFINGEELKPPCDPDLYGGEVVRGGPKPGYADRAGQVAPDDVLMDVALGNKYASFEWQTVEHTVLPVLNVDKYKEAFNANKDVNDQSQNWRVTPRTLLPGYTVEREETPNEARKRMKTDPDARDDNNYHSAVLHSPENHRWVTAMDVAIGQAVSLDDPDWRDLLVRMGDWKLDSAAKAALELNPNHGRLSQHAKDLIDATADYYQSGTFPPEKIVSLKMPDLVTSETQAQEKNPAPPPPAPVIDWGRFPT